METLETKPPDATHWRSLAKRVDLSHSTVGRIWRAFGLQPHRSETFKSSRDPLFVREGARCRRPVSRSPGSGARAERGREESNPSARSHRPDFPDDIRLARAAQARLSSPGHDVTPTSASWLNLVECWFALLSQKQITHGAHRGVRPLETAIREYLAITNEARSPSSGRKPLTRSSLRSRNSVSDFLIRDTRTAPPPPKRTARLRAPAHPRGR